jgi:hypothetical protein
MGTTPGPMLGLWLTRAGIMVRGGDGGRVGGDEGRLCGLVVAFYALESLEQLLAFKSFCDDSDTAVEWTRAAQRQRHATASHQNLGHKAVEKSLVASTTVAGDAEVASVGGGGGCGWLRRRHIA